MLRLLIVDDEPLALRGIEQLLRAHDDVQVVAAVSRLSAARDILLREPPDAILLDIALGQSQNGFELLADLPYGVPPVIFITAHAQYAVDAFQIDAVDYLLKPVRPERLQEALQRLRRRLGGPGPEAQSMPPAADRPGLLLRTPNRTVRAALDDLILVRADGDYSHVYLAEQPPLMVLRSLRLFTAELPKPPFLRVGRSWIVNCARVLTLEHPAGGVARVHLRGLAEPLTIGQAAAQRLAAYLTEGNRAAPNSVTDE